MRFLGRLSGFIFVIFVASFHAGAASKLTLHGKILKPDNTPVSSSSVSFQIEIRSPGVENCLLYQETQTLNLSSNPGVFNLSIGSGTRPASTVDGGFTLNQIFQNRSLIDLSAAAGACTNPATSYTPASDDQRNISIQFNDGSGWQSVAVQKINPVPRALDSGQVGGYDSAQLLRVADGVPTAQTELSGAQWTELLAVISGTSTVYSKPNQLNGVNLPVLSNGQTMVWNAGAWTAVTPQALPGGGTNGQVLTSDGAGGATWTTASSSTDASLLTSGTLGDARLSSNVALKNAANTFSIGNQNITNGAPTEVNLILKAAAAQSANMLEVRNSANTLLYSVETSGTPVANTDLSNKAYVDSTTSTLGANYVRKDGTTALTGNWAVGNFDIMGISNIGAAGYLNQSGMAAPAVSAAGEGRIYFDSVAGKFKVSQNGGAFADLVGAGGGGGDFMKDGSVAMTGPFVNGTNSASSAMTVTQSGAGYAATFMGGDVGVGTIAPTSVLHLSRASGTSPMFKSFHSNNTSTTGLVSNAFSSYFSPSAAPSGTFTGINNNTTINTGINSASVVTGFYNQAKTGAGGGNVGQIIGIDNVAWNASGTATTLLGISNAIQVSGDTTNATMGRFSNMGIGNTGTLIGLDISNIQAAGTVTTEKGININLTNIASGVTTTGYGVYVGSVQATNPFSIYTSDATAPVSLAGAFDQRGMAAPAVSAGGQGRIYFDSTSNTFKVSQNGAAYADLVSAGGGGDFMKDGSVAMTGPFVNGTNSASSAMTVTQSGAGYAATFMGGNVGIGTTSPSSTLEVSGDLSLSKGADRAIQIPNATSGAGNALTIKSADGVTIGGSLSLTAGRQTAGGTGGALTLGGGEMHGGGVTIAGGTGDNNGYGGPVSISAGNGGGNERGSDLTLRGGNAGATSGAVGGKSYLFGGNGNGAGAGGDLYLNGGTGSAPGNILISTVTAGNVGIGTTSPDSALHVAGKFNLADSYGGISIGPNVLTSTVANKNIMIGADAWVNELTAVDLISIGSSSGGRSRGIAIGTNAMAGSDSVAVGYDADGFDANSVAIGAGSQSLGATAVGRNARAEYGGITLGNGAYTWANKSIAIGNSTEAGNRSIAIGHAMTTTIDDSVTIGRDNLPRFFISLVNGNVGIGTTTPQTTLQVAGIISPATNNTYTLGSATYRFTEVYATNGVINTSDRREKKDIYNSDLGLNFINKLRPVSYRWNTGVDSDIHYGLIAQEAEEAIADLGIEGQTSIVTHDEKTDRYGVRYSELISPIIKAVQEIFARLIDIDSREMVQARKIASIQVENEKLKEENAEQSKELADLKARLEKIERSQGSK